jgi:glutamyl-tRNA reductase
MTLLVVGVSHRSAPVPVLDRLALAPAAALDLQRDVVTSSWVAESMVLSTCNRVEVYADVARFHGAVEDVTSQLAKRSGLVRDELTPHLYVHYDERAAQHLFEVAAGLDSMVVGEQQILGQVRHALKVAQESATAGRTINDAGQAALRVGKRVHAETGIDRAGASVVSVALDLAGERLGDLSTRRAVVVGAGAMSGLAVALLARRGVAGLTVVNRTPARAQRLAASVPAPVEARAAGLEGLADELADVDLVVSCTGSVGLVLTAEEVRRLLPLRGDRPLVVVDLALPHDTDPALAELPGVTRIDLADLADLPAARASESDVATARRIVAEEVTSFATAQAAQRVEPIVVSLRARAADVVEGELARLRMRLPGLDDASLAEVERALRRASATLLHTPTVRMKQLAADPEGTRYAEALRRLFDLDPATVEAVATAEDLGPDRPAAVDGLDADGAGADGGAS